MMASRSSDKRSWKEIEFPTLLQLLQPVEANWEQLALHLMKEHEVTAIKAQCHHSNAGDKALVEAIKIWSSRTVREHRKWRTLCAIAEKWDDKTLPQFLKDNNLSEEDDPVVHDVMKWAKNSPLRVDWYTVAVELVGNSEANAILANHSGGGNKECLRKSLNKWWNSSVAANRNWQTIVDALEEIGDSVRVVEDIIDKCST